MEHHGANVWGGGGVKHAGVSVCPMATAGMLPPGTEGIPQSRAALPGYENTTSLDMCPIPEEERQKSSGNSFKQKLWSDAPDILLQQQQKHKHGSLKACLGCRLKS